MQTPRTTSSGKKLRVSERGEKEEEEGEKLLQVATKSLENEDCIVY